MSNNILFFFPHNPFPARSGAHRRCLEMLMGLRELGYKVVLLSSEFSTDNPWEYASIQSLKTNLVTEVYVHKPTILDLRMAGISARYYRYVKKSAPPLRSWFYVPIGMRRWFSRLAHDLAPDTVFMSYAYWDALLAPQTLGSSRRIIENHDLVTLNRQMQSGLRRYLTIPPFGVVDERILAEDFFEKQKLSVEPEEFDIYDSYDVTVTISLADTEIIKQNTTRTRVLFVPMSVETTNVPNSYDGSAIYAIGPNLLNVQGYLYFIKKVLPLVTPKISAFRLQVTGIWSDQLPFEEYVVQSGFLPDLRSVYATSRFAICPLLGGTGQQIKIVEAMAHGLPVIAMRAVAKNGPIEHGINGLIAENAEEFADHVIHLWNDRERCQRLGTAARDTIASKHSKARLLESLQVVMQ
jgi:glycosyltransferase involved in cell wall biosynthesis